MCWFVSKKKYDAMVAERDKWDGIAAESIKLCQEFREHAARWEEVARSCQEDNKRLISLEEEMLAKMKQLEKQRDMWRERAEEESMRVEAYRDMLERMEVDDEED